MRFEYAPGATPIDMNEARGPHSRGISRCNVSSTSTRKRTSSESNEWLFARRRGDPLDERFIHTVHRRMFNQTWRWAGQARRSDKNIGVSWVEIPARLRQMVGDVRAQIEHRAYSPTEIAARYHHRLVAIHVFPNGNGRHARLMADLLISELAGRRFDWGRGSLVAANELRARYIAALKAADGGDIRPLLAFLDHE